MTPKLVSSSPAESGSTDADERAGGAAAKALPNKFYIPFKPIKEEQPAYTRHKSFIPSMEK